MKILSLTEFGRYCKDMGIKTYVYNTKNQKNKKSNEPINVCIRFNEVFIGLNPNIIFFKNASNTMNFSSVRYVRIYDEENLPIEPFTIVCREGKEYTFLGYNN